MIFRPILTTKRTFLILFFEKGNIKVKRTTSRAIGTFFLPSLLVDLIGQQIKSEETT